MEPTVGIVQVVVELRLQTVQILVVLVETDGS
jgi:hypothetical protein